MTNNYEQFEQRKQDHIKLALMPENQTTELSTFDSINLIHDALPDLNLMKSASKPHDLVK